MRLRELYACQIDLACASADPAVLNLFREWIARGSGATATQLAGDSSSFFTDRGHELTVERVTLDDNPAVSGWLCSWRRLDDTDMSLSWRMDVAVGSAPEPGLQRFAIRIGVERGEEAFRVAPARYDFASPAIVRTLIRAYEMRDGGARVEPLYHPRRAQEVGALADLLLDESRRLPVFVITRKSDGRRLVDAGELARQLAGLAHVEVLTTHLSALGLTDRLGGKLSVWGGAVRIYWPGFSVDADPKRHRFWTGLQLEAESDFVARMRAWLGSLATVAVPEHPVATAARAARRSKIANANDVPDWVQEVLDATDADLAATVAENQHLREALARADEAERDLENELRDVRRQFQLVSASGTRTAVDDGDVEPAELDVLGGFELAVEEGGSSIIYLESARKSVEGFVGYQSPRRLYEALTAVNEAAGAWTDGSLGPGFGVFFADRGYEYSARNRATDKGQLPGSLRRRVRDDGAAPQGRSVNQSRPVSAGVLVSRHHEPTASRRSCWSPPTRLKPARTA